MDKCCHKSDVLVFLSVDMTIYFLAYDFLLPFYPRAHAHSYLYEVDPINQEGTSLDMRTNSIIPSPEKRGAPITSGETVISTT